MKKSILTFFVLTLFTFSCSNEGITEVPSDNNRIKEEAFKNFIQDMTTNEDYINLLGMNENNQFRNESNNGVVVIEDGTFIFFGIFEEPMLYLFVEDFNDDYIALMPNGNARFFAHSNNPLAAVVDLSFENPTLGNSCIDERVGRLNANLVASDYDVLELPDGRVIYTINEASTTSVLVGHSKVSDAQLFTPPEGEPYCTEATMNKMLNGRVIYRDNNNGNGQSSEPNINFNVR